MKVDAVSRAVGGRQQAHWSVVANGVYIVQTVLMFVYGGREEVVVGMTMGPEFWEASFDRGACSAVFSDGGAVFSWSLFVGISVFTVLILAFGVLTLSVVRGGLLSKVSSMLMEGVSSFIVVGMVVVASKVSSMMMEGVSSFIVVGMVVVAVELTKMGSTECDVGWMSYALGEGWSACTDTVELVGSIGLSCKSTVEGVGAAELE